MPPWGRSRLSISIPSNVQIGIAAMLPDARLIVLLRNPVDRAYSQFGLRVRMDNLRGSFEEFVEDRPYAVEWGFYSARLNAFRERFGPDRILVLIYEEATRRSG